MKLISCIAREITDSFYKDLLYALETTNGCYFKNILLQEQVVWNNKHILCRNRSVYNKQFLNAGLIFVNDFLDHNNRFLSWEVLKTRYKLEQNQIMEYNSISIISKKINKNTPRMNGCNFLISSSTYFVKKNVIAKTLQDFYCEKPDVHGNLLKYYSESEIKHIYIHPFTLPLEPHLKIFKYMLLHNRVYTNLKLQQMNMVDTNKCNYCDNVQTKEHMFHDCELIQNFWKYLYIYLKKSLPV